MARANVAENARGSLGSLQYTGNRGRAGTDDMLLEG